ncbi:MAG TPA: hypothetical protein VJ917_11855 [Saprospiraceae bacterium]|nr:hypothetical protein [Saprospiraceae bacterium]
MKFQLPTGREVRITDFLLRRSYAGVVHLSESMLSIANERIINGASYPEVLWGENRREIYPGLNDLDLNEALPEWKVSVWLTSKPTAPDFIGSELILTFFTEIDPQDSIVDITAPFLEDVDWEKEAKNYDF